MKFYHKNSEYNTNSNSYYIFCINKSLYIFGETSLNSTDYLVFLLVLIIRVYLVKSTL